MLVVIKVLTFYFSPNKGNGTNYCNYFCRRKVMYGVDFLFLFFKIRRQIALHFFKMKYCSKLPYNFKMKSNFMIFQKPSNMDKKMRDFSSKFIHLYERLFSLFPKLKKEQSIDYNLKNISVVHTFYEAKIKAVYFI